MCRMCENRVQCILVRYRPHTDRHKLSHPRGLCYRRIDFCFVSKLYIGEIGRLIDVPFFSSAFFLLLNPHITYISTSSWDLRLLRQT
jgi:hypothetical protein